MKKIPSMPALPSRVLGCYWPVWNGPALSAIPSGYNTIWLFAAVPVGGPPGTTGAVTWSQNRQSATQFNIDLSDIRAAGRCVILSVGGANSYIDLSTRTRSDAFTASIEKIHTQLGGFDGVDLDIEGGTLYPSQMVYISEKLKAAFGSNFVITYPPAPWSSAARNLCSTLYKAGVLDLVAPQYYDLEGLSTESSKISNEVSSIESAWLPLVNYNAAKVGLGYGLASVVSETMMFSSFATVWKTLVTKYPALRGALCWEAAADHAEGWSFETTFHPLIIAGHGHDED